MSNPQFSGKNLRMTLLLSIITFHLSSFTTGTPTGSLFPLYIYPSGGTWAPVVSAKQAYPTVPVIAVINPNSGPGTSVNSDYTNGINNLQAVGVTVIGYVYTSYGTRSYTAVTTDISTYCRFYPKLNGIFLDEMADQTGQEIFYTNVSNFIRTKTSCNLSLIVGNPGTTPSNTYYNVGINTLVIYENSGEFSLPTQNTSQALLQRAGISYDVSSINQTWINRSSLEVGYLYVTEATLPNPYGTYPTGSYSYSNVLKYLSETSPPNLIGK